MTETDLADHEDSPMKQYRLLGAVAAVLAWRAVTLTGAAQRQFPVPATIRGENIWLRAEPAEDTAVAAHLQRGDAVTITGPDETVGGETFVPVEVVATRDSGWVRELAIDPGSLVTRDEPIAVDDDGGNSTVDFVS